MENYLTEEELKRLKYYAAYALSHGSEKITSITYTYDCYPEDFEPFRIKGTDIKIPIDDIQDILINIVNNYEFMEKMEDCGNVGTLIFDLDCENFILTAKLYEQVYEIGDEQEITDEIAEIDDEETRNQFISFLNEIKESGNSEDTVNFSGSGDSGDIEGYSENQIQIPKSVKNYLYRMLESHFGGWEINEGSQGNFVFNVEWEQVTLNFSYYEERDIDCELNFELKF